MKHCLRIAFYPNTFYERWLNIHFWFAYGICASLTYSAVAAVADNALRCAALTLNAIACMALVVVEKAKMDTLMREVDR